MLRTRGRRCLFWAKNRMDSLLWDKSEGDGKQLTPLQSMASGFSAACLGPVATGPFDVVKVRSAPMKAADAHGHRGSGIGSQSRSAVPCAEAFWQLVTQ